MLTNDTIGYVLKDRYEIVAEIGSGGMSNVYLAKDLKLDSYWAVKRMKNDYSDDIQAYKKEVELLSSLNHSDIPRIVDAIETNEYYYVIMDFIDGISLKKKTEVQGVQSEKDIVEWSKMLCDILIYLHTVKKDPIVYQDMKPDNVMLTNSGRVKLIDFGIAKVCKRGEKQIGIGTPGYAAPEQYGGGSNILDERTDIYSLGATMFYLATGHKPNKPPAGVPLLGDVNPLYSEGLEQIIYKCTQDDPNARYNSCEEVKADLENIDKITYRYRKKMKSKLLKFASSIVLAVVFFVVAIVGYNGIKDEQRNNYLYYYDLANTYSKTGDYEMAADNYKKAIESDPSYIDTYVEYFDVLMPQENDERYDEKIIAAIRIFKNSYIDNSKSDMHMNYDLMYMVAKKCLELSDLTYYSYAAEYLDILYENGYEADDLLSYKIIADNLSKNSSNINFKELYNSLIELEEITDKRIMNVDERLGNYYNLVKAYLQYPVYISEQSKSSETDDEYLMYAYDKVLEIGDKVREILESDITSEDINFNGVIKLNELVVLSLCNQISYTNDSEKKYEIYSDAKRWFGYLDEYNFNLSDSLKMKKANVFVGIYENGNNVSNQYLLDAIDVYESIVDNDDTNFLAKIYLTEALLKYEKSKDIEDRDYSKVLAYYEQVVEIQKERADELQNNEIAKFSALKQEMKNMGLEE